MTLGIMAAEMAVPHVSSMTLFIVCCAALSCMAWQLTHTRVASSSKSGSYTFGLSAMLLSFAIGMFLYVARFERMESSVHGDEETYVGTLRGVPVEKRRSWMLRLADASRYDVVLYVVKDSACIDAQRCLMLSLQEGDTVVAHGRHVRSVARADTVSVAYARWLLHSGVCATSYVRPHELQVSRCGNSVTWHNVNARMIQRRLHGLYEEHDIDGEAGDIIEAMSIGWKSGIQEKVRRSFSRAGASHMLALSGFHVGVVVLALQCMLMFRLMRRRAGKVVNLLIVALLWMFVTVAGASPSLVRAGCMFTLMAVCAFFDRSCKPFNVCVLTYVLMLCANPMTLFEIGFQLSFLAVAGICVYGEMTRGWLSPLPRWLRALVDVVTVSVVCTLATAPLVAHCFGSVSLVSLASNLVAPLFLYVIVAGSFVWWATLCWPPLNDAVTSMLMGAASALNAIMDYLASLPFAAIEWRPGVAVTVGCYVVLAALVYVACSVLEGVRQASKT